jgi:hypothetical protein
VRAAEQGGAPDEPRGAPGAPNHKRLNKKQISPQKATARQMATLGEEALRSPKTEDEAIPEWLAAVPPEFDTPAFREALSNWERYQREDLKVPLTPSRVELHFQQLKGSSVAEAIGRLRLAESRGYREPAKPDWSTGAAGPGPTDVVSEADRERCLRETWERVVKQRDAYERENEIGLDPVRILEKYRRAVSDPNTPWDRRRFAEKRLAELAAAELARRVPS